jgi:hypothetical protein
VSSAVSLGASTVFTYVGSPCPRLLKLQVLPCVKEFGGIRHKAWQFKRLPSGAVRIFSSWMLTNERKTDDSGQNNDKCEYFKCLSSWQTTHIDHKHMCYISHTQHQFFFTNLFGATCFGSNCDPPSGMMIPCGSKHVAIFSVILYYKYLMNNIAHFGGWMLLTGYRKYIEWTI